MPRHIISKKAHRLNEDKDANPSRKKEKRPNPVLRLLAFLLTVVMVLGAIFLIVNYDKLNFDSIKRWFAYRDLERETADRLNLSHLTGTAAAPLPAWTAICWCVPLPVCGSIQPVVRCMWTARSPWKTRLR